MAETLRFDLLATDHASRVLSDVGNNTEKLSAKFKKFAVVAGAAVGAGLVVAGKALAGMTQNAIEDDAAQRKLALGIQNATGATDRQVAAVERWIGKQGKLLGVTDDELRPAFQRLVQATGSVGEAQRQLNIAMDVSAGTGKSLKVVSEALMKANNGTTASLSKLGLKTKDASGETLTLDQALKSMADTFEGQAAAKAGTLDGKMQRLKVIFDETKESIGSKLIPVVTDVADQFLKLVNQMEKGRGTGGQIVDVANDIAGAFRSVKNNLDVVVPALAGVTAGLVAYRVATAAAAAITAVQTAGTTAATGATWSLNAALRANPIGIVVTALTALGVGLVIAYNRSETFRKIVDGAFDAVKEGASRLADGFRVWKDDMGRAFDAVARAGTWLWNNALQPAFRFIVEGIASILDMWSSMLSTLGKVPGFGWAKTAAEAMANAAEKARNLADGIQKIPTTKRVDVTVAYKYTGLRNGSGPTRSNDITDSILPRGQMETAGFKLGELFSKAFRGGFKAKTKIAISAVSDLVEKSAEKLQGLRDKASEITTGIADAMRGGIDFAGLGSVNDDGTRNDATSQLANFAETARQFAANLQAAAAKGLSSSLIQKIAQLGPGQGLTASQALAAMDQAQVASANASLAAVDAYARQLGQTVLTTTSLPADIAREQANHDALVAILQDLRSRPQNISFTVNDATDPDKIIAAIRRYIKRNGKLRELAAD